MKKKNSVECRGRKIKYSFKVGVTIRLGREKTLLAGISGDVLTPKSRIPNGTGR